MQYLQRILKCSTIARLPLWILNRRVVRAILGPGWLKNIRFTGLKCVYNFYNFKLVNNKYAQSFACFNEIIEKLCQLAVPRAFIRSQEAQLRQFYASNTLHCCAAPVARSAMSKAPSRGLSKEKSVFYRI